MVLGVIGHLVTARVTQLTNHVTGRVKIKTWGVQLKVISLNLAQFLLAQVSVLWLFTKLFPLPIPPPPLREKSPMQVYSESTGLIILHFSGRRIYGMGQLECLFQNLWAGPTVTCKGVHQPCASSWRSRM